MGPSETDTVDQCGDTNNGFGLLYNWNKLGDGEHDGCGSWWMESSSPPCP